MKIWINDRIGFLTGYSTEPNEGQIAVDIDITTAKSMQGGLIDFHNYYYDGNELTRNTNNDFQRFLYEEDNTPTEPTKEEMAERLAKLEVLLADLL
ncbi:hypothetical protein CF83_gp22 [Enterococcus phage IME_EF3]|uniref:Uncharacterized protein n=1 Tax=Enterococcus phage IME_EF3 TaxID=1416012 RepID=V5UQY9_9CAUD|nr:hypothetical protein CF83_gp22 [Enterococcus phage IME_EF3]AHB79795.1 hypothetical protein [Enterococcus phage IME_EF3]